MEDKNSSPVKSETFLSQNDSSNYFSPNNSIEQQENVHNIRLPIDYRNNHHLPPSAFYRGGGYSSQGHDDVCNGFMPYTTSLFNVDYTNNMTPNQQMYDVPRQEKIPMANISYIPASRVPQIGLQDNQSPQYNSNISRVTSHQQQSHVLSSPQQAATPIFKIVSGRNNEKPDSPTTPAKYNSSSASSSPGARQRTEKKPIPNEMKDKKYFDRRKRNNEAAKKSRDSRKQREDEIAIRASFLEKENAVLRAQLTAMKEEANSLREMLRKQSSTSNGSVVNGSAIKSG